MATIDTLTASEIRAWRNRMGYDRQEAAAILGVAYETYKAYENDKRALPQPKATLARRIESEGKARVPTIEGSDIIVVGGGTVVHVRNHLALCAPAYGTTAKALAKICAAAGRPASLKLTRMADPSSPLETNDDMAELARRIVADPRSKIVFWNPAICDYIGAIAGAPSGRKASRLKTSAGLQTMQLSPADKIVSSMRATRKDIYLVAFKTTTGASEDEMYLAALDLMKGSHINLILANDTVTGFNMVVTPEEARYHATTDRAEALEGLVDMALLRSRCTFTHSDVVDHPGVAWSDPAIPDALRTVVDHCIARGAYRAHDGKRGKVTAGHFAVRGSDGRIITSRRWSNFNALATTGMVLIEPTGKDSVIAYGGKPSVGGQSQRIIFADHPSLDGIVHFHSPLKEGHPDVIPVRSQRPYECGSHECGRNASDGLAEIEPGIYAVMLDQHGPNIVFGAGVDPARVIALIERNFALDEKTGGAVSATTAAR